MADGNWKKRALFAEVRITEDQKVLIEAALTKGEYTTQELAAVINRLTVVKERADKLKKVIARDRRKRSQSK